MTVHELPARPAEVWAINDARKNLNRFFRSWRDGGRLGAYMIGTQGSHAEGVLVPVQMWQRLVAAATDQLAPTAVALAHRRLAQGPATPTTLPSLAELLGLSGCPVRIIAGRGVPSGAADVGLCPGAEQELREMTLRPSEAEGIIRLIADLLKDTADLVPVDDTFTRCSVVFPDGERAAVVTSVPGATNRVRGRRPRPAIYLASVAIVDLTCG